MGTDLRELLQNTLGTTYTFERELGGGGMSRVFVAEETALGRKVVVKTLPQELSAAVSAERFRREIQLAASLQHPHIVPLLAAGQAARPGATGPLYYTMPFVEGETLRARLERELQLPLTDALRLVREVAEALDYAHRRGVVHRDVKPENVLLSDGHALVADFGIARALSTAAGDRLTGTGVTLGTPDYMSPEQASGESEVDARSDVYSLGCLLYELLAGEPPFKGPTAQVAIARRFMEPPPPLRTVRDVPAGVEQVILRALARKPADRFQTAAALAEALRVEERAADAAAGVVPRTREHPATAGPDAAGHTGPVGHVDTTAATEVIPTTRAQATHRPRTATLLVGVLLAIAAVVAWLVLGG